MNRSEWQRVVGGGAFAVLSLFGCAGPVGGGDAGPDAGVSADAGLAVDGGQDAGLLSCAQQSCDAGHACCDGTYCWGFSNTCQENGTCPAAGITTPTAGLCSCDGFWATPCDAGLTCPAPVHGHVTYCQ